jgi:hypothetical protein
VLKLIKIVLVLKLRELFLVVEYTQEELDNAYLSLSDEQKRVLDEHVKRGRKTRWLNAWAEKKGNVLTDEQLDNPDETMHALLDWILLDYEERLSVDPNLRCECGRALKRRYTVLHKGTGKTYKLGEIHFTQHTGLDPEIVRLIRKGLAKIDLERDEILSKVIEGWELPIKLPRLFKIPIDISALLNVSLPLLDRQVQRLQKMIVIGKHKNLIVSETPQVLYLSRDEFKSLVDRLKTKKITTGEARELFEFMKNHYDRVEEYGFDIQEIKKAATKALGYFSDRNIRWWLVEIESFRR